MRFGSHILLQDMAALFLANGCWPMSSNPFQTAAEQYTIFLPCIYKSAIKAPVLANHLHRNFTYT
jgi:hypothetical protein